MPVADIRLPAFVRLDAQAGWQLSPASEGIQVDPRSGAVEIGFASRQPSPLIEPTGSFGGLTTPTGVAIDDVGGVLVAHPDGRAILHAPDARLGPDGATARTGFAPLWPGSPPPLQDADLCAVPIPTASAGPYDLRCPRGLAFNRDGDLALIDQGDAATPARLIIYTWPRMAVRAVLPIGGEPWDVACDGHGRLYVADAMAGHVRRFDRLWREEAWPGGAGMLQRPRHLVIDADDVVFVIDDDPVAGGGRLSRLTKLGAAIPLDDAALAAFWRGRYPAPLRLAGSSIHVPGSPCTEPGLLLANIVVDRRGRLPEGPSLLYRASATRRLRAGRFISGAIDSGAFDFAWHRMRFEMALGAADALAVRTFCAATPLEPQRIAALGDESWSTRAVITPGSPYEAIIRSAPGQYLWIELSLIGDGTSSPKIDAIEMLGPRNSSLRLLPAPFHEDAISRDFLDRFLSYFDTVFSQVEQRITRFPAQLSAAAAPEGAFLAWLAGWFDIDFLAQWPDATRRAFVAQAMQLHRTRGTIAGLQAVLRLHLSLAAPLPVIIEGFRLRDYAARRGAGDLPGDILRIGGAPLPPALASGDTAHRFLLVVPQASLPDDAARETLIRLVDRFRPAHTAWDLITASADIRIGCQSMIGVDMIMGTYPSEPLGSMRLGQSAQLPAPRNFLPRLGDAVLRGQATI